jgi:hypothetical protein
MNVMIVVGQVKGGSVESRAGSEWHLSGSEKSCHRQIHS